MFTAAILPAVAESGEMLRPLEWGELSARFDAVRDVRGLMARPQGAGNSFAAHALAGLPHEFQEPRGLGEPCVNLDGIGTVNRYETIDVATNHNVATGDQGTR